MTSLRENKPIAWVTRGESKFSYCYLFPIILFSILMIPSLFGDLATYTFMYQYTGGILNTTTSQLGTIITHHPPLVASASRNVENDHDPMADSSNDSGANNSTDGDVHGHYDECNMFSGEWVPNPEGRYYSSNCSMIMEHNCINHGRPDLGFMKWKWRPAGLGCDGDLPDFDPFEFLAAVKGKSMAFVGDSIGRNQMQSLICLLSEVEHPEYASSENDIVPRWRFKSSNFTVAMFWSPFLVRTDQQEKSKPRSRTTTKMKNHSNRLNIYLDEPDHTWTTKIQDFDFLIISAGHWFNHPLYYHISGHPIGCTYSCDDSTKDGKNLTAVYPIPYGYRAAFRTSFRAVLDSNRNMGFNGTIFLRTFSPGHFEGVWNEGADCPRKEPRKNGEVSLEGEDKDFYLAQLEEFNLARDQGKGTTGIRFRVLDVTKAMLLRPDGHPSTYRRDPSQADCVHWCLPGPIDYWNTFLLQMIKRLEH